MRPPGLLAAGSSVELGGWRGAGGRRQKEGAIPQIPIVMSAPDRYAHLTVLDLCELDERSLQEVALDEKAPEELRRAAITFLSRAGLRTLVERQADFADRSYPGLAVLRLVDGMLSSAEEATLTWGRGTSGGPVIRNLRAGGRGRTAGHG